MSDKPIYGKGLLETVKDYAPVYPPLTEERIRQAVEEVFREYYSKKHVKFEAWIEGIQIQSPSQIISEEPTTILTPLGTEVLSPDKRIKPENNNITEN